MPEFRWTENTGGFIDLADEAGKVVGYIGRTARGMRGYVVQSKSEWPPRFAAFTDHTTAEAARWWVEAEVSARSLRPVRIVREEGRMATVNDAWD